MNLCVRSNQFCKQRGRSGTERKMKMEYFKECFISFKPFITYHITMHVVVLKFPKRMFRNLKKFMDTVSGQKIMDDHYDRHVIQQYSISDCIRLLYFHCELMAMTMLYDLTNCDSFKRIPSMRDFVIIRLNNKLFLMKRRLFNGNNQKMIYKSNLANIMFYIDVCMVILENHINMFLLK